MIKVTIEKSWFYSAGTQYKWDTSSFDVKGVGVDMNILRRNNNILLEIDKVEYELDCSKALYFIHTFKSIFKVKNVTLGIISKSLLVEHGGIKEPKGLFDPPREAEIQE